VDLIERLHQRIDEPAPSCRREDGSSAPVFSLMRRGVRRPSRRVSKRRRRKIDAWIRDAQCVEVAFDDNRGLFHFNTPRRAADLGKRTPA